MILGIDTSLGTAVAVIDDDGHVRAEVESVDPRGHAEVIGSLLERVLAEAGASSADITSVAAGMGPGPFTGLRVGIAAARAFALGGDRGRGIRVVPVVSHDAVALELLLHSALTGGLDEADDEAFAVVTDARRREVAYTVYRGLDDDGLPRRLAEPALALRAEIDGVLDLGRILRRDAERIPASLLAVAAARAVAARRVIGPDDALYLRSPDVTLPAPRKKVIA